MHIDVTHTVPEGAVGVGMWVFCFIYTSFELSDYAYDVCDRSPLDVLESAEEPWTHVYCWGGGGITLD